MKWPLNVSLDFMLRNSSTVKLLGICHVRNVTFSFQNVFELKWNRERQMS